MPVEFLTDDEAAAYGRFTGPPSQADLERVFFLDDEDRVLVGQRRGEHMRLGFALQLVTVRWLGTFLEDPLDVPGVVLDFVAKQLEVEDPSQVPPWTFDPPGSTAYEPGSARLHDVFTPEGLGHLAGHVWQQLTTRTTTLAELAGRTGLQLGQVTHQLHPLNRAGLAAPTWTRDGWVRGPVDRDASARHLDAAGVLEGRALRYQLERLLWQWWTGEVDWLRLPRETKRQRYRADANQQTLALNVEATDPSIVLGRYLRATTGRPDHATAAAIILDTQLTRPTTAATAS